MTAEPGGEDGLDKAIAKAESHAYSVESAYATAPDRTKPIWAVPVAIAALCGMIAVGVYDYRALTAPPDIPTEMLIASDLRASTASVVREIEAMRSELGRVPTRAELDAEDLLTADDEEYRVEGDGYVVRATDGVTAVEYRSGTPIDQWVLTGQPR